MSEILTAKEVSEMLKINLFTVYSLTRKKVIPSIRIGRLVRYDLKLIKKFIETHTVTQAPKED